MASLTDLITRVRRELGDLSEPFRQSYRGTGDQDMFDLPVVRVDPTTLKVYKINTNAATDDPNSAEPTVLGETLMVQNTDYTLDSDNGIITLTTPLAADVLMIIEGYSYGMFSDDELTQFIDDAVLQHTAGRTTQVRYRDEHGFIQYDREPISMATLPTVEEAPVSLLATIECLWALSTDAATDVDVITSEGTHIPRSQRFAQLQEQIAFLMEQYQMLCSMMGVGLFRIEVSNLRRVSRTTNRFVPVFVEREYDETHMPTRITPPVDSKDADWDGPPSPAQYPGTY